jgi:RNA polymerase sigma-70 factor (ECF subfamily)
MLSHPGPVREYTVIDLQRLRDEGYREEVVVALVRDHGDAIMRFCVARLGEGVAEEVTQEVFVAAWEGLLKYRLEVTLRAWLFGIARNKCQQTYRNRARRQAIDEEHLKVIRERAHAQGPLSPEDAFAHATLHGQLHDSLSKLPSEDRILLTLWYWKELPVAEIADIMGKTEAAIRKRLTRTQQRLKELMHEVLEPP